MTTITLFRRDTFLKKMLIFIEGIKGSRKPMSFGDFFFTGGTLTHLSVSRVLITKKSLWLERSPFTVMHIEYCFSEMGNKNLSPLLCWTSLMCTHSQAVICSADYKDTHTLSPIGNRWVKVETRKQTACPSPSIIPATTPSSPISQHQLFLCASKSCWEGAVAYA